MQMAEQEQERRGLAEAIAEEAGVIERCPDHDHMLVRGAAESSAAYALGVIKFKAGLLAGLFASLDEMKSEIQAAIRNAGTDCEACEMREAS